jgi:hypothetical protein
MMRWLLLTLLAGLLSTVAFVILTQVGSREAVINFGTVVGSIALVDLLATGVLKWRHR